MALPAFHALTGCDTTSAFFGKGKKTAWSVWQSMPELTLPLQLLSGPSPTTEMIKTRTPILQRFVLKLYGVSEDDIRTVDAARLSLFLHKGKDFDHMPPSSDALHQHLLRAAYQVMIRQPYIWAHYLYVIKYITNCVLLFLFFVFFFQSGHVWGNMLVKDAATVSPSQWGWQQDSPDRGPTPLYTTTAIISKDLPELVICKCKTDCKPPCKCCMQRQPCMSLCGCRGSCSHSGDIEL